MQWEEDMFYPLPAKKVEPKPSPIKIYFPGRVVLASPKERAGESFIAEIKEQYFDSWGRLIAVRCKFGTPLFDDIIVACSAFSQHINTSFNVEAYLQASPQKGN